jgi:hypothetical protein
VSLTDIACKVLEGLRKREPDRSVEAVIADRLMVEGDVGLLTAAMENLLGNAWMFTSRRASARIEVPTLRAKKKDDFNHDNVVAPGGAAAIDLLFGRETGGVPRAPSNPRVEADCQLGLCWPSLNGPVPATGDR